MVSGGGAAGTAIVTLLLEAGVAHVLVWDREGILAPADPRLNGAKRDLAQLTNPGNITGDLHDALRGADVFIGVSAPGVLDAAWIADMAASPIVFALANPDPEVDVDAAREFAAVVEAGVDDPAGDVFNRLRALVDLPPVDVTAVTGSIVGGILGLGLSEAAYMAEIARAGILSVDKGQAEAAQAKGIETGNPDGQGGHLGELTNMALQPGLPGHAIAKRETRAQRTCLGVLLEVAVIAQAGCQPQSVAGLDGQTRIAAR